MPSYLSSTRTARERAAISSACLERLGEHEADGVDQRQAAVGQRPSRASTPPRHVAAKQVGVAHQRERGPKRGQRLLDLRLLEPDAEARRCPTAA
jgi:hypothetical protein